MFKTIGADGIIENFKPAGLTDNNHDILSWLQANKGLYAVEPKYDGERVLLICKGISDMEAVNRYGTHYKFQWVPDLLSQLYQATLQFDFPVVLDAEMVSSKANAVVYDVRREGFTESNFVVFDILQRGKQDLRAFPLYTRRTLLEAFVGTERFKLVRGRTFSVYDEISRYFGEITKQGFEGVVVKPLDSIYADNRWLKWKNRNTYDVVVLAIKKTPSYKRDKKPKAFQIGYVQPDKDAPHGPFATVEPWGDCSSGYAKVPVDQLVMLPQFEGALHIPVKASVVMEIKAHSVLPSHRFREPSFVKYRPDKKPEDCKPPESSAWVYQGKPVELGTVKYG